MADGWKVISNSGQNAIFECEGRQIGVDKPSNPFIGELFCGCLPDQVIDQRVLEDFIGKKISPEQDLALMKKKKEKYLSTSFRKALWR